ncbi:MAG: helix-turn-helix transcriptional regulator [Verrucomicrobiota bacterium]
MAHKFQELLLEQLNIRLPGVHVRRLALNLHMDEVELVKSHSHPFQQLLLYLRGRGLQRVEDQRIPVRRGSLISVRSGEMHEFYKEQKISPICLAIDLKTADFAQLYTSAQLNGESIHQVDQALYRLGKLHQHSLDTPLAVGAEILGILALFQRHARERHQAGSAGMHPVTDRIRDRIRSGDLAEMTPSLIAKQQGKTIDHLNRQLRSESGVTIGQLLAAVRLEKSCELLRDPKVSIGEAAAGVGYLDQNYFARWFRKQTGQTPSEWRK